VQIEKAFRGVKSGSSRRSLTAPQGEHFQYGQTYPTGVVNWCGEVSVSVSICFIALAPGAQVTPNEVFAMHQSMWPGSPPITDLDCGESIAKFRIGSANGFIVIMRMPIPFGHLDEPCKASFIWPTASQELLVHDSHFVVTVTEGGTPLETLVTLTRLTASILASCKGAIGVYSGDAGLVVSAKLYREAATALLQSSYPIIIWMSVRLGRTGSGGTCGYTIGLSSLGLCEIEVASSNLRPSDLAPKLYDLALYLLKSGAVVKEGDTVGQSA
jgi:hypothetical protein